VCSSDLAEGGLASDGGRQGLAASGKLLAERLVASGWLVGGGLEGIWWTTKTSGRSGGLPFTMDRSQLGLGAFVLAERPVIGRTILSFSLGGGMVRVNTTDRIQGQADALASGWAPTARATALLGYRFSAGMPFVEIRSAWVGDPHLATDPGNRWPLFLQVGYRLDVH
jgi:hypothetical protein